MEYDSVNSRLKFLKTEVPSAQLHNCTSQTELHSTHCPVSPPQKSPIRVYLAGGLECSLGWGGLVVLLQGEGDPGDINGVEGLQYTH